MTDRRLTSPTEVAMRRLSHLLRVQRARAEEMRASAEVGAAKEAARAGGCTEGEISHSIALIERAARVPV